jgi:hypothetical protein
MEAMPFGIVAFGYLMTATARAKDGCSFNQSKTYVGSSGVPE